MDHQRGSGCAVSAVGPAVRMRAARHRTRPRGCAGGGGLDPAVLLEVAAVSEAPGATGAAPALPRARHRAHTSPVQEPRPKQHSPPPPPNLRGKRPQLPTGAGGAGA